MTLDDLLTYAGLLLITAGSLFALGDALAGNADRAATIVLAVLQ